LIFHSARDEASSARVGSKVYVLGGVGDDSVEFLDLSGYDIEADESEYIKSMIYLVQHFHQTIKLSKFMTLLGREALEVSENQLLEDEDIRGKY